MGRLAPAATAIACFFLGVALHASPARQQPAAGRQQGSADRASTTPTVADQAETDAGALDPLGPNAACYVCHLTFVDEPLARTHLQAKVTCIDCHGLSAAHANDEDIGATPPDKVIQRAQINQSCRHCHKTHDVRPEELIARWLERARQEQASRTAAAEPKRPPVVCTDCHGRHKVRRAD